MEPLINRFFFLPYKVRVKLILFFRKISKVTRVLPDFIIIGAMKSGTTSLINYLMEHPHIKIPLFQKEVHFFDDNFNKGVNWYRSFFPTKLYKFYCEKIKRSNFLTGEKSPYYIFHPLAPQRVAKTVPKVKIIILLRNPIDRAYSHYNHSKRNKREFLSFENAIKKEFERLKGEELKIITNKNYKSLRHSSYSYVSRGIYINQIKKWFKYFPEKQILIIKSEDMYKKPQETMTSVYKFLGIKKIKHKEFKKIFAHKYPKMNEKTRNQLKTYFEPYNQQLGSYLQSNFDWD